MNIELQHIVKKYGPQLAVNDLSFQVSKGEILGLLGPNGAGKTTTMRIICGLLTDYEGTVKADGEDIRDIGLDHKRKVGYLAEHNPLYIQMYIKEFLQWVAKAYRVDQAQKRIKEVIAITGLEAEKHKKIRQLSKGYRQRVGLAQAILHQPELLVLDEPTSGLDPNQLLEIRSLIKEISKDSTVIFSSHIMQEVKAICHRVVILSSGKKVADNRLEELLVDQNISDHLFVQFEKNAQKLLEKIPELVKIESLPNHAYDLYFRCQKDPRILLFDMAAASKNRILEMKRKARNMEEIFKDLTS